MAEGTGSRQGTDGVAQGDLVRAAGAVLWRRGPKGPQIALVHRPKYDDWSFPKGKFKNGEHVLRVALREVEEETGVRARLGRRLPTTTYLKGGRPKRVDYWAATPLDEPGHFEPGDEVDQVRWLPTAEAERLLTYDRDVDLLHEFAAGPLHTTPLVILRHACAGDKRDWRGPDALRPLDARGRAEATELAELLGAYGPLRPISSCTARCAETVIPYALRMAEPIGTDLAFTVGETSTERARVRLAELVENAQPVIVCTHGEIVADLVTELCRRLGEKVPDDPTLRKGSFWVAHLAADEISAMTGIAALERHSAHAR